MSSTDADEALDVGSALRLVRRCWPYYRPQLKHIVAYIIAGCIVGVLALGAMVVAEDIIQNKIGLGQRLQPLQATFLFIGDEYVTNGQEQEAILSATQRQNIRSRFMVAAAIWTLVIFVSLAPLWYYAVWIFQRVNQQLRIEMLSRAEHLSLRHHSFSRTGDTIYRVYQDSATITNVLQFVILTPLRAIAWILFASIFLLLFSPWFGLFIVGSGLLIGYAMRKLLPVIREKARLSRELNSDLTSRIQENLAAARVIKASGAEQRMMDKFEHDSQQALDAAFDMRFYMSLLILYSVLISMAAFLIAEYFMATWAMTEKATYLGGLVALLGYARWNAGAYRAASDMGLNATQQTSELAYLFSLAQDLTVGLKRAFYLLDLEPEVRDAANPQKFPVRLSNIQFDDVRFGYQADKTILKDVAFSANAGTVTAIIGGTGSGKSTLMSLLLRLYDPDAGEIRVNGEDIRQIALDDLRRHIAIALQQNVLFALSISDNIRYGIDNADQEQVIRAAKIACAHEFIAAMPEGYSTELGERGGKLSAGQRQRLSIARAILRDTPILILDEPTASLDAETEQQVMRNLTEWGRDRIVFIITHRLSTIRSADQIVLLENGSISQTGTHQELIAQTGPYRSFVSAETGDHLTGVVDV